MQFSSFYVTALEPIIESEVVHDAQSLRVLLPRIPPCEAPGSSGQDLSAAVKSPRARRSAPNEFRNDNVSWLCSPRALRATAQRLFIEFICLRDSPSSLSALPR